jgi:hypothetical protein
MMSDDLKLSVKVERQGEDDWLRIRLESQDGKSSKVDHLLTPYNTLNRRYHIREGIVIAMRSLMSDALKSGLIKAPPPVPQTESITLLSEIEL